MTSGSTKSVVAGGPTRAALFVLAGSAAVIPVLSGNLSTYGIGGLSLLYDTVALPRLVLAVIAMLAAAALWALVSVAEKTVRWHPALIMLAGVAVLATVSSLVTHDPLFSLLGQSERLEGLVTWWLYAAVVAISMQVVAGQRDLRTMAEFIAASAGLLAVYGLLQFFGIDWVDRTFEPIGFDPRRAFATFSNPNFLAGFLVLALPLGAGLAVTSRTPGRRGVWWVLTGFIAAALFATFTRGAWIAALVELVLFSLLAMRGRAALSKRDATALAVAGLLLLAVVGVSLTSTGEIGLVERLTVGGSTSERLPTLQAAAAATAEKPLLGWGPDTFLAAFRHVRPDAYAAQFGEESTINNAHSWPFQVAATLGIPAALLFVGALVWALAASSRFTRSGGGRDADAMYIATWVACVGFLVHMLFNVAVIGSTFPFFVLLGSLLVPCTRVTAWRSAAVFRIVGVAMAVGAVAAAAAGFVLLVADHNYVKSRHAFSGAAPGDAYALAVRASHLNPTSVKYARGAAETAAQRFYDLGQVTDEAGAEIDDAWRVANLSFSAAEERHPGDYATLAWYAALLGSASDLYGLDDLHTRAVDTARLAASLDRHAVQVEPLAQNPEDPVAILTARSVPRLP